MEILGLFEKKLKDRPLKARQKKQVFKSRLWTIVPIILFEWGMEHDHRFWVLCISLDSLHSSKAKLKLTAKSQLHLLSAVLLWVS